jgi:hypothetical protein
MIKTIQPIYCVITKTDLEDDGNLADELIYFNRRVKKWRFLPNFAWENDAEFKKPWRSIQMPVFYDGEIVVLNEPEGREIGGMERCPRKWCIEYKEFTDISKAIRLSKKIMRKISFSIYY